MSDKLDQSTRMIQLLGPLPPNEVVVTDVRVTEWISRPFVIELNLWSTNPAVAAKDVINQNVTVRIELPDKSHRFFNGIVHQFVEGNMDQRVGPGFVQEAQGDRQRAYNATLAPWFWFLQQTSDLRIFQEKTVLEIIEQIFQDSGFTNYELKVHRALRKRIYCVQYRETDFHFVSRLLEEEGIFYYFRHENGKHTMVIGDQTPAYEKCRESEVIYPEDAGETNMITGHISSWAHRYSFHTGKWAQTDYNFETPSANLMTNTSTVTDLKGIKSFEDYDYPGIYPKTSDGKPLTDIRQGAEETGFDIVEGTSGCDSFTAGGTFKIQHHPVEAERGKSFVHTMVHHTFGEPRQYSVDHDVIVRYKNEFHAIPDSVVFLPNRDHRKPFVQGPHTAVVVGPSGEEIYTDKYGRVKVQFHWDREGKRDEKSSCWIRCMQTSAGRNWGSMFIPRIGQEVIVEFLEGDPDRPIITGVVYNAEQMPAYELPKEKTKSYIKTNSSLGGKGYNEVRFEDKAGQEQIFTHAQKDMDERVLNDSREWIGNDRHLIVKANQFELVEKNKHGHVIGNHQEKIDADLSVQVGGKRNEKVGTVDAIEAGQEIHLKAGMKIIVEAGMQISLVGPGGFVDIGPGGVTIQGTLVKINSGGSAGSGSGSKPEPPEDPVEADNSKTGSKSSK